MFPKNLSTLSNLALKAFLNSFDDVFCDLGGVVWGTLTGERLFEGIEETFSILRKLNKKIHFVTHNSFMALPKLHSVLSKIVPGLLFDDVVTPVLAMISYLKDIDFDKEIFFLGTSVTREEFEKAGFKLSPSPPYKLEENITAILDVAKTDNNIGAVIFDSDVNINYLKVLRAVTYLQQDDVFFFTGSSELSAIINGRKIIGGGPFQNLIEEISGRPAIPFGKPSKDLGNYLIKKFNIQNPSRSLFVGDSLQQDIALGNLCGFQSLLTLSGCTKLKDINDSTPSALVPKYYIDHFGNLGQFINSKMDS